MPFFHDQNREALRRHYLEAWRKRREGLPLDEEALHEAAATGAIVTVEEASVRGGLGGDALRRSPAIGPLPAWRGG